MVGFSFSNEVHRGFDVVDDARQRGTVLDVLPSRFDRHPEDVVAGVLVAVFGEVGAAAFVGDVVVGIRVAQCGLDGGASFLEPIREK